MATNAQGVDTLDLALEHSVVTQKLCILIETKVMFELSRFLFAPKGVGYDPVRGDEVIEKECCCSDAAERASRSKSAARRKLCLYFFLACQSIVTFLLVIYIIMHRVPSDIACARKLSPYC